MTKYQHYDPERAQADMTLTHPCAIKQFSQLAEHLILAKERGETKTLFMPFECYRTPQRQRLLYQSGKGVTKAGPFQSAHQYGLAVDFVPWDAQFSWDERHDWGFLSSSAVKFGLHVPYKWDRAHVEHPRFDWIRQDIARM